MAESGVVAGMLDADGESSAEGSATEASLDPTAAALAAEAAKSDPDLAKEAAAYFRKQGHLVDVQTEHLHEQRAVNLSLLKLKFFGERLRVGTHLLVILAAAIIAVALLRIVWSAVDDHHLVVETFSVPPDLAARGINGEVIAAEVLDKLGQINAQANSTRAASSYAANWGEQVKLEIPETGVSIAELQRFFRDWLGHETHVTGEVIHSSGDLSLTVRAGEEPGRTVTAKESDIAALTQQAAEAAFAITQPYRYSAYLDETGRRSEALEVARALARDGPQRERPWAWAQISNLLQESYDGIGAVQAAETAMRLDPRLALAYYNAADGYYLLGDDEQALRNMRISADELQSATSDILPEVRMRLRISAQWSIDDWLGDFRQAVEDAKSTVKFGPLYGGSSTSSGFDYEAVLLNGEGYELARGHDVAASLRIFEAHPVSDADSVASLAESGDADVSVYERDIALEDWAAAAADMRETIAAAPRWPNAAPVLVPIFLQPRLAYALARGGQQDEAERIAAALPKNCYRCALARGWVATTAHDWSRADREFAQAVLQGPSLPAAYADWGAALLERGDPDSAIKQFAAAHQRGPHWADPLKAWGDALENEGKSKAALAKYDEALKYAPNWKQLKEARELAAKQRS